MFTSGTTAEPRGVVLTHANLLANLEPIEKEVDRYRRYERIFHPLRFLDLLPLSHVFGQLLGIFIPQIVGATSIFLDTLNPSEILRTIHDERVSVLVTVPRLIESLRDQIEAGPCERRPARPIPAGFRSRRERALSAPLVALPLDPQPPRLEILGDNLGRRHAPRRSGNVLEPSRLRRDSRLRTHRDNLARQPQSPFPSGPPLDRQSAPGPGGQACRRRRNSGSRRKRRAQLLEGFRRQPRTRPGRMVSHRRHRRTRSLGQLSISRAAEKM